MAQRVLEEEAVKRVEETLKTERTGRGKPRTSRLRHPACAEGLESLRKPVFVVANGIPRKSYPKTVVTVTAPLKEGKRSWEDLPTSPRGGEDDAPWKYLKTCRGNSEG
jgi:hypothetical protein